MLSCSALLLLLLLLLLVARCRFQKAARRMPVARGGALGGGEASKHIMREK